MASQIFLSVIIPCFNEEKNIRSGVLNRVWVYLKDKDFSWEVIIVDDGSDDKSKIMIEDFIKTKKGFRLVKNSHQGKARTVMTGVLKANGQYILFTDLDQATPISESEKLLKYLNHGYQIVIGSRNSRRAGAPLLRSLMGPVFALIRRGLIGLKEIKDTQCGFKAFENRSAKKLFKKLKLYGYTNQATHGSNVTAGFDVELLFIAKKMGYKIKEVPVSWHYVETRRVNPVIDSFQGLIDILRIKFNDLQGKYR